MTRAADRDELTRRRERLRLSSRQLRQLARIARDVEQGRLESIPQPRRSGELGALERAFFSMTATLDARVKERTQALEAAQAALVEQGRFAAMGKTIDLFFKLLEFLVVACMVAMVIMRRMGMSCAMAMIVMPMTMIMRMIHLVAARIAPVRAKQRDRACDQRADERQAVGGCRRCCPRDQRGVGLDQVRLLLGLLEALQERVVEPPRRLGLTLEIDDASVVAVSGGHDAPGEDDRTVVAIVQDDADLDVLDEGAETALALDQRRVYPTALQFGTGSRRHHLEECPSLFGVLQGPGVEDGDEAERCPVVRGDRESHVALDAKIDQHLVLREMCLDLGGVVAEVTPDDSGAGGPLELVREIRFLASVPRDGDGPDAVVHERIERADQQLYRAKAEGRNRTCLEMPPVSHVSAEEKGLLFGTSQFQDLE